MCNNIEDVWTFIDCQEKPVEASKVISDLQLEVSHLKFKLKQIEQVINLPNWNQINGKDVGSGSA